MNREKRKFFEKISTPITTLMSLNSSLEEGMQATINIAVELGTKRICIFLKDTDDKMTLVCGHPKEEHELRNKKALQNHLGLKEIMERKKMFIVKSPATDKRGACTPEFCRAHDIKASLFIRLEIDKKPMGAIVIDATGEKTSFSKHDIIVAKIIAQLATKEIHNRKRIEREAKQKIFRLVAQELTHEIRNPLVLIGGFANRLEKLVDKNPEEAKEAAKIIKKEVERIEGIVKTNSQLLNQKQLSRERVSVIKLIRNIIEDTKEYTANCCSKKIEIHLNEERVPSIYLDKYQMKTALFQIFKNAVDAIKKEGEIFVRLWKRPHFVCLEIANTGSYIPESELETIFAPFYTTKRGNGGLGLGLAITQQVVEKHGGQIEVRSTKKPKKLTCFEILLPTQKPKEN